MRLLLAYSGLLSCGSVGAFFLFVPPLLIAAAWIALVALPWFVFVLLDCYGIQLEFHPEPSDDIDRTA